MKYGIASYHRPECDTVKTLLDAGINPDDIIISVQCQSDYEEYSKRHKVKIIYAENDCAGGNRNNLLKNINDDLCLLDDDVKSFAYWNGEKYVTDTKKALLLLTESLNDLFDDVAIIGISASGNGLVRKGRRDTTFMTLLQGTFLIIRDKDLFFDERWKMVEDYEISLRAVRKGRATIRFNNFVANKPKNGTNKGGLHDRYKNGEQKRWIRLLAKIYPEFHPNKDNTGGCIRFKYRRRGK